MYDKITRPFPPVLEAPAAPAATPVTNPGTVVAGAVSLPFGLLEPTSKVHGPEDGVDEPPPPPPPDDVSPVISDWA